MAVPTSAIEEVKVTCPEYDGAGTVSDPVVSSLVLMQELLTEVPVKTQHYCSIMLISLSSGLLLSTG